MNVRKIVHSFSYRGQDRELVTSRNLATIPDNATRFLKMKEAFVTSNEKEKAFSRLPKLFL